MDPYLALRQQAATKRDDAIALARRIYRADIKAIEELQHSIAPTTPTAGVMLDRPDLNTIDLIRALLPLDRSFTTNEVIEWLTEARPGQKFRQSTVRVYLWRLSKVGIVKKLCATDGNSAVWLATEAATDGLGVKGMTLAQMVEAVLQDAGKPLKTVEIAVAMHGRGYRSNAKPHSLMRALRDMFKRCPGRFVRNNDGRWGTTAK